VIELARTDRVSRGYARELSLTFRSRISATEDSLFFLVSLARLLN